MKRLFYVTVRQTRTWNLTIDASSRGEAMDKADDLIGGHKDNIVAEPDYSDWDYETSEVKGHYE